MNEQKYYVKLKFSTTYLHVSPSFVVWFKTKKSCGTNCKTKFTKSELAEIMDGALYKFCEDPDNCLIGRMDCKGEWINPLIELVPAEEG